MQFSTSIVLCFIAAQSALAVPTLKSLSSVLAREENKEAFLTAFHDPKCSMGPGVVERLPLPADFTLSSNASQSICHPLPKGFAHAEFAFMNWGFGKDAIPCGLSLFKTDDCHDYAAKNWYRRDGNCVNMNADMGGPWGSVSFSGCVGEGTPNGKPTDDPNIDPNEN